jgi:hypothetical protein
MHFTRNYLRIYLLFFLCFFNLKNSFALDSLSYSGRLVQTNGAPVAGPVTIRAQLVYTDDLNSVLCSQTIPGVILTKGVFHVKLNFICPGKTLTQVLSQTPANESVAIQITDMTNTKSYSYQALHALPYASVASQLTQMGAGDGEFLKWDDTAKQWKPGTVSGASGGTVTTVTASGPLSVATPTSTPAISISQANTTTSGYLSSADWNTFNSKEGTIAGGTATQFYRGDKSWQTLDTSAVPENVNLYFTNARVLGVPLTGFATATGAIVAADTTLAAFGKAQGQINAINTASANYLVKNSTDSVTGVVNVGTTGLLQLAYLPLGMNDATNKSYVDSEVGNKVSKSGDTVTGVLTLDNDLKIKGGSNHVTIKGHATSANYNLTLPQTAGTAGYVLSTDGSGSTTWITPAVGSSNITDGSIVDADVNASAAIAQSKIANLTTDLSNKQPLITAGTIAQYYRGDKTFVDLGTDVRATALTGFATGANSTVLATDTTLAAFQKVQGQIDATNTAVGGKEPVLANPGDTTKFYRGDKSWQTLNGSAVANTAAGNIVATNVQSALNELDSEKQNLLTATSIASVAEIRFYELPGNGTEYVSLKAPNALTANLNYIFPSAAPSAGQVLSSDASGNMSWITIPSAPIATVFGRSGAVTQVAGDYTASQITNTPAGSIAATNVQAALNELDTDKEPALTNPSDTTKYYRGDKTWATFATDAINSVLTTFSLNAGSKPTVTNTDTVVGAFGKVQKTLNDINTDYVSKSANQTINGSLAINSVTGFITVPTPINPTDAANKSYVDGFGQWTKSGSDIYFNSGNVGVGTTTPARRFDLYSASGSTSPLAIRTNDFVSGTTGSSLFVDFGAASGNTFTKISTASAGGSSTSNLVLQGSGGNVGINTTTPASTLDVNGVIRAQQICDSTGANCKTISSGWGNVSAASMVANWPDAIVCDNGTDKSIMYHDTRESGANLEYYSKPSASHQLRFNATTGAFYDNTAFTGASVCAGKSISTLVSEGRTFGLLGGGVDWTPNGANVYRAGGNVGLGIATPSFYQHGGTNRVLEIHNPATAQNSQNHVVFSTGSTAADSAIGSITGAIPNSSATNKGVAVVGITTGINSTATNPTGELRFLTRGSADTNWGERMRVTETGNVGIGTQTPSAKLDVAGDIKATGGGTIGVTRILGTFGNAATNIPSAAYSYIGDNITLTPGNWIIYYDTFYDHDGTPFSFASYNHPSLSTTTSSANIFSYGSLSTCGANFCPVKATYQVTVASTTTYYILQLISSYTGSYVRIRGGWGNFYALKVN